MENAVAAVLEVVAPLLGPVALARLCSTCRVLCAAGHSSGSAWQRCYECQWPLDSRCSPLVAPSPAPDAPPPPPGWLRAGAWFAETFAPVDGDWRSACARRWRYDREVDMAIARGALGFISMAHGKRRLAWALRFGSDGGPITPGMIVVVEHVDDLVAKLMAAFLDLTAPDSVCVSVTGESRTDWFWPHVFQRGDSVRPAGQSSSSSQGLHLFVELGEHCVTCCADGSFGVETRMRADPCEIIVWSQGLLDVLWNDPPAALACVDHYEDAPHLPWRASREAMHEFGNAEPGLKRADVGKWAHSDDVAEVISSWLPLVVTFNKWHPPITIGSIRSTKAVLADFLRQHSDNTDEAKRFFKWAQQTEKFLDLMPKMAIDTVLLDSKATTIFLRVDEPIKFADANTKFPLDLLHKVGVLMKEYNEPGQFVFSMVTSLVSLIPLQMQSSSNKSINWIFMMPLMLEESYNVFDKAYFPKSSQTLLETFRKPWFRCLIAQCCGHPLTLYTLFESAIRLDKCTQLSNDKVWDLMMSRFAAQQAGSQAVLLSFEAVSAILQGIEVSLKSRPGGRAEGPTWQELVKMGLVENMTTDNILFTPRVSPFALCYWARCTMNIDRADSTEYLVAEQIAAPRDWKGVQGAVCKQG
eukprot:m51a1_g7049 hypothetical protein (640) ;mRNA; f:132438-137483